jgi:XTP/dITP diphosphohydrolase
MKLVLATNNLHKRDELEAVLRAELGSDVEIITLDEITPPIGEIEETGSTLEENALIKARTVFDRTQMPTIADDTGLEVLSLKGAPGVYSARYAGLDATYNSNIDKLLGELGEHEDRSARFRTVIAYINAEGEECLFNGEVKGTILQMRRGENGFGYDPVFAPNEDEGGRSFAEMTADQKNAISHRSRALRKLTDQLKKERIESRSVKSIRTA